MKIKTKLEIGQEVKFKYNGEKIKSKINSISIDVNRSGKVGVIYFIDREGQPFNSYLVSEKHLIKHNKK